MSKIPILYYSSYGHIETMAQAVAVGARAQMGVAEVTGGSRYSAGAIADGNGSRRPSANELASARSRTVT